MDLTEAEDIKKMWQEYTELYKKDLHSPDNHDGVITHLEPDILECEVKWALESTQGPCEKGEARRWGKRPQVPHMGHQNCRGPGAGWKRISRRETE